jgi:glycosyltransferase involved in cell wall biosynthesis
MNPPLVSVVIPVYNGAKYLGAAIESVLAQSYQPIEIIIIDDGSTDDSLEVIRTFGSRVYVISQPNAGVGRARNVGIGRARGEFVAFLDQDDWWMPEKVQKQVRLLTDNPQAGLAHTGVKHYDDVTGTFVGPLNPALRPEQITGNCYEKLLLGNAIYNSSVMVRKKLLDQVGGFDLGISGNTVQDYDLWIRLSRESPFAYLSEELLVFRLHPEQGTWNRRQMLNQELQLLERLAKQTQDRIPALLAAHQATLWCELGLAQLDAFDHREARRCLARSIAIRWSIRATMLYFAAYLPQWGVDSVRRVRSKLRRLTSIHRDANVPTWVGQRKN